MARRIVGSALIICLFVAVAAASSPASLGSAFADSFTALAPLYTLHRAYGDYLFQGIQVKIPPGLCTVCADFATSLADLHLEFIVQTDLHRVEEVTFLAHLRMSVVSFCRDYQEEIAAISALQEPDMSLLTQAAEAGMFAAIFRLNRQLEDIFTLTLDGFDDLEAGWEFSAAFITRTLIHRGPIERVDPTLRAILLGPEEDPFPREVLPSEILAEVDALVALAGREITAEEQREATTLVREIHDFLLSNDADLYGLPDPNDADLYDPPVPNDDDLYDPSERILLRSLFQLFVSVAVCLFILVVLLR